MQERRSEGEPGGNGNSTADAISWDMADERTVRHAGITGIPVQSVEATVIEGPDAGKQASAHKLTIGSARDNDLVLSDETVSRYHVELWGAPDGVRVSDPGSTNGTWV